jgi:two-component system, chemotaxis family, protein-glutamate methylesterase/glutaminase
MSVSGKTQDTPRRAIGDAPYRVMVVDDSSVVRVLVVRMLEADPGITVVASVCNGRSAVDRLKLCRDIDVVVLDIEMPVMDGLTALSLLLAVDPTIQVIMASTLTQHNAEISLRALEAGAADYVPKPSSRQLGGNEDFRRELLAKVKALAAVHRRRAQSAVGRPPAEQPGTAPARSLGPTGRPAAAPARPSLRAPGASRPEVIAIGCSTGGPQALAVLLKALQPRTLAQPILITQHMPPTFTAILADHLGRAAGVPCAEARSGEPLAAGRVYVAPGDHHLLVETAPSGARLRLTQDPPENFCRPSVDPMLRSVARCYGRRALAVILTGMGSDGLAGSRSLVEAGGSVVAQDQASSVVWGMPGAVAGAGLCCAVEPLERLAGKILTLANGGNR